MNTLRATGGQVRNGRSAGNCREQLEVDGEDGPEGNEVQVLG